MLDPRPVQALDAAPLDGDDVAAPPVGGVAHVEDAHPALGAEVAVHRVAAVGGPREDGEPFLKLRRQREELVRREIARGAVGRGGLLPAIGAVAVGHADRLGRRGLEADIAALAADGQAAVFGVGHCCLLEYYLVCLLDLG